MDGPGDFRTAKGLSFCCRDHGQPFGHGPGYTADRRRHLFAGRAGRAAGGQRRMERASYAYGGDHSHALRDAALLDPAKDPARIRAMYVDPDFARQGPGRAILTRCEAAARAAGFASAEMMATLAGEPLYRACGYTPIESIRSAPVDGVHVPLIRMGKPL
ncbi:GNAT family N-acetyltransferase [Sphingomonas sp. UMB7805-LC452B]|nr:MULTISPECIES: GNAT family N-acetyltransferase [Sphingomonas]MDK8185746.1 GNAT family N-acetyltransferase [Sphingomonas zeae]MDK8215114.1 GNAT family N-acetyltransferase [Sphingomonas sp. UMB7805-LC452B]